MLARRITAKIFLKVFQRVTERIGRENDRERRISGKGQMAHSNKHVHIKHVPLHTTAHVHVVQSEQ